MERTHLSWLWWRLQRRDGLRQGIVTRWLPYLQYPELYFHSACRHAGFPWKCHTGGDCENNVFDSRNITSEEYHSRQGDMGTNREWLFAVNGAGDNPSVSITGNRFTATDKTIRLLLYKYNEGQSPRARRTVVKNNSVGRSSRLVLKSLNSSKWTYGNYQVK